MKSFLITLSIFSVVFIALPTVLSFFTDKFMLGSFLILLMWHLSLSQGISDLSDKLKKVILIWILSSAGLTTAFVIGFILKGDFNSLNGLLFLFLFGFSLSLFCILTCLPMVIENFEKRKQSAGGYKMIFWARLCSFIITLFLSVGIIGFFSYALRAIILRGNVDDIGGIFILLYIAAAFPLIFVLLQLFTVIRDYKKLKAAAALNTNSHLDQQTKKE
jgi:hypothetical protein